MSIIYVIAISKTIDSDIIVGVDEFSAKN